MIAMAALSGGTGTYTLPQVVDIFTTAYTSFRAAKIESKLSLNNENPEGTVKPYELKSAISTYFNRYVVIHTGNWGCGAFGGNRPLMAVLQCAAAKSAGIDKLVYHTFNKEGTDGYNAGVKELGVLEERYKATKELLEACVNNSKFVWGESDGN